MTRINIALITIGILTFIYSIVFVDKSLLTISLDSLILGIIL